MKLDLGKLTSEMNGEKGQVDIGEKLVLGERNWIVFGINCYCQLCFGPESLTVS